MKLKIPSVFLPSIFEKTHKNNNAYLAHKFAENNSPRKRDSKEIIFIDTSDEKETNE